LDPTATWNAFVVYPLADGLRFLYSLFGSYGIAIIMFTVIVRLVMLPLSVQQLKSSKAMQELQPQVQALQKRYGKDKEKLNQETMKLYKEAGVNPLSGCLPTLIQMPIWIGLYAALFHLAQTQEISGSFLWINNLANPANTQDPLNHWTDFILPVITVLSQWITQKMMTPAVQDPQAQSMNSMMAIMPIMFGFFALQVPAGLVLYWVASNIFSMVQQYFTTGWGSLANWFPKSKAAASKKSTPPPVAAEEAPDAVQVKLPTRVTPAAPSLTTSSGGTPKTVQMLDMDTEPDLSAEGKRRPKRGK